MSDTYAITDLQGYVSQLRQAAADSLSADNQDNLNDYISLNQVIGLVNENCLGFDELDRPILDEDANETIFDSVAMRIYNVGLAKLAAQDLIECAWDNESNEMIFWSKTKKKEKKKNDKPRTRNKNMGDKK